MQDVLVLRIHDATGPRLVKVTGFPASIGRSVFGDVPIEVDGVSLKHAEIERLPDGFLLRDAGSKNGTAIAGAPVKEHVFRENGSATLGGVRVDFVLTDAGETTQVGLVPAASDDWGMKRVAQTIGMVSGLYLAVCVVEAFKQFGNFWPPEKPSEIFTDAVAIFAGLAAVSFFAALWSKLNTKRFNYVRLLAVVTGAVAWFLLLDELDDMITYNLWTPALRTVVPPAVLVASATAALILLLRPLFPAWRRLRLGLSALALCGVGFGLGVLRDHYRFEESDKRAAPVPLGLPLSDPRAGAQATAAVMAKMQASIAKVQEAQQRAREEIDADEAGTVRENAP